MNKLKALFKYTTRYKTRYILGILVLVLIDALHLIPPKILGNITDALFKGQGDRSFLLKYIGIFIVIALLIAVGRFVWRILIVGTSKRIEYDMRNKFFSHLQRLSVNFYNKNKTGDLMALATNDLNAVVMCLGFGVVMIIDSIFLSAITIVTMLTINIKLTLLSLIPLPFISITASKFGKKIHKRFIKVQKAFSELTDMVQENFSGIRVIKSFVQEEEEFKKFTKENEKNLEINLKFAKVSGLLNPLIEFIASLGFVIFIALGGYYVIYGEITLGDFVAFNMYLGQLIWPMMAIGWVINVIQRGFASLERIEKVLDEIPEIEDKNPEKILSLKGDIEIKDLTFRYPEANTAALNNINIKIKQGETLGIIGRTGSGKTTLINLLVRLFNVDHGKILINKKDINLIPLATLRENIGLVSDPFLFSTTIAENINLPKDELNMERVIEAAKGSHIYENIMDFPEKFNTMVGERGVTLSGGQRQRVSISRSLIKDPEIIIFDDCLSAVDAKTEVQILENLNNIMKDKTSLIISHRISAVKDSDNIIVLDEGFIIEEGTHQELLAKKGLYYNIYEKQLIEQKIQEEGEN